MADYPELTEGFWSGSVVGNWRVIFRLEESDACEVNYVSHDYR